MIRDRYTPQTKACLQQGLKFVAVIAVGATVAGCQSGGGRSAVSLEEARKITADFGPEATFVPPPRTITDVVAALDT